MGEEEAALAALAKTSPFLGGRRAATSSHQSQPLISRFFTVCGFFDGVLRPDGYGLA